MDRIWWGRPLRAIAVGLLAGLAFTWFLQQLSEPTATWTLLAGLGLFMIYVLWAMYDLRKMRREHELQMARFHRAMQRYER